MECPPVIGQTVCQVKTTISPTSDIRDHFPAHHYVVETHLMTDRLISAFCESNEKNVA